MGKALTMESSMFVVISAELSVDTPLKGFIYTKADEKGNFASRFDGFRDSTEFVITRSAGQNYDRMSGTNESKSDETDSKAMLPFNLLPLLTSSKHWWQRWRRKSRRHFCRYHRNLSVTYFKHLHSSFIRLSRFMDCHVCSQKSFSRIQIEILIPWESLRCERSDEFHLDEIQSRDFVTRKFR